MCFIVEVLTCRAELSMMHFFRHVSKIVKSDHLLYHDC